VTELVFYHNPRCSKSRQALALLEARGLKPRILRYLETPPDAATLDRLLQALGMEPRQIMRKQEAPYRELGLDDPKLSRKALIEAMVQHPLLIERPILVKGAKAVLGRPPEQVLSIL
jgi:arsenate reductase